MVLILLPFIKMPRKILSLFCSGQIHYYIIFIYEIQFKYTALNSILNIHNKVNNIIYIETRTRASAVLHYYQEKDECSRGIT